MPLLFYPLSCHLDFLQDPPGVKYYVIVLKIFMTTQALLSCFSALSPEQGVKILHIIFQDICPKQVFFSSNSYILLSISVGPLVKIPVGGVSSLLDISKHSSLLIRGDRYNHFLQFVSTYCSTIYCNFSKLSLKFSSLVPRTVPTSGILPLKVFGIYDFVLFLVVFL